MNENDEDRKARLQAKGNSDYFLDEGQSESLYGLLKKTDAENARLRSAIGWQNATIAARDARITELKEALRPFAFLNVPLPSLYPDEQQITGLLAGITPTKRSAHVRDRLTHADNFDFLRESVQWFATVMEVVLRKNDHKGGWENEPFQYFIDRMRDELSEIEGAIANLRPSDGDLIDLVNECADLANFAMMLAENAHRKAMEWDEEEAEHGRE